ncbi:hypothetical protein DS745_07525 [Anaerobacillus alkaliphilus]|uniref:Uncharacterized protein n=1 Tax=Anaerobacillus alkaliphilus TaxID=1548597 RepID=A0A4Q0VVT1_9BACI|nr:hypothetical protein [Anaerobacillus alkaliphilus]RXJ02230.1 hypothetical protein DS745_07525 [Anaerobacillus alkaliphilus]
MNKKLSIEIFTVGISLIALIFSGLSYYNSTQSLKLSYDQHHEQKTPIWLGAYDEEKEVIQFEASNPEIKMQLGHIIFPSSFNLQIGYIAPGDYAYPTTALKAELKKYLQEIIEPSDEHYSVVESFIPVVIQSNYVAHGHAYKIQSIYHLYYIGVVSDENTIPTIDIKGMWFDSHLDPEDDALEEIDEHWEFLNLMG